MGFAVERVESIEGFRELEAGWDLLAADVGHPFASHAWIDAWLTAFAADSRLAVYTAWDGDRLAAAIPLVDRGAVLAAAANAHTPWFSPLTPSRGAGRLTSSSPSSRSTTSRPRR